MWIGDFYKHWSNQLVLNLIDESNQLDFRPNRLIVKFYNWNDKMKKMLNYFKSIMFQAIIKAFSKNIFDI